MLANIHLPKEERQFNKIKAEGQREDTRKMVVRS